MANKYIVVLITFSCLVTGHFSKLPPNVIYSSHGLIDVYGRDYYAVDDNKLEDFAASEKVKIKLFYESLCPDCMDFDTSVFTEAIYKLGKYLNISTYPYGNAETRKDHIGHITFKCQHGPAECYGNKLHACALDVIANATQALLYNSCMMERTQDGRGSDDKAADRCAYRMWIDAEPIKRCAKGDRAVQLLKYYGEESRKINFTYVPYVIVGKKVSDKDSFIKDICEALTNPPRECSQLGHGAGKPRQYWVNPVL